MLAGKIILMTLERYCEGSMLKSAGKFQPADISRIGIQVCQHFLHPAKLRVEHRLDLLIGQISQNPLRPGGKLDFHLQGRLIACITIGIAQAGIGLMQHIPGRPQPVKVKTA